MSLLPNLVSGGIRNAVAGILAAVVLSVPHPARAASGGGSIPESHPGRPAYGARVQVPTTPLVSELRRVLADEEARLAELRARHASADPAARAAIQREIETVKRSTEARVIEVQIAHARRAGDAELVARLARWQTAVRAGLAVPRSVTGGAK